MFGYLPVGILALWICLVQGHPHPICTESRLKRCGLSYLTSIAPANSLFQDEKHLNLTCPIMTRIFRCSRDFFDACEAKDFGVSPDFVTQLYRMEEFVNEICTPETALRKEYLRHSRCLRKNKKWLSVCFDKATIALKAYKRDHLIGDEDVKTQKCLLWNILKHCWLETVGQFCGNHTSDKMMELSTLSAISL